MRNFVKGIVFAVGLVALGAGCGKKEANCQNAVDNVVKIMMNSDEAKKASAEEKKMMEAMIGGLKGEMVKQCNESKSPDKAKALECLVGAKSEADLKKCPSDFMK
jgi:hypothetical protein